MKYLRRAGLFMAFFAVIGTLVLGVGLTSKVSAAGEKYEFKDASTIIGSGGDYEEDREFKKQSADKFVSPSSQCNKGVCITYEQIIDNIKKNPDDKGYAARLSEVKTGNTTRLGSITISDPKGVGPNGGSSNPIDGGDDTEASCEDNSGPFAWFLCPVTTTLDTTINFLDKEIQERLLVDESKYDSDQINRIWETLRNVAFLILVPIMLVMVIGTAVGFGPFDAYTVKKALPRLFAAVIFIALSLPVCQFFINLANIAGTGILGLMTAPLEDGQLSLQGLYDSGGDWGLLLTGGLIFTGLAAAGQITIGILISYAFVAFLAFLIAYLVLLMRELVLIFLLVIAPLAILAWIFPGNDKPWKLWRGAFINLLIMFPLIMGLIAAGRIMAELIDTTQGNAAQFLLKITAYILPYFFIPATFKVAGGLFATVAGIANDRSRGIFDRQTKSRQETRARGMQDFKSGSGYGRFRQTRAVQSIGQSVGAGTRGRYGFGKRGAERIDQLGRNAAIDRMKTPEFQAIQDDDYALRAATYSSYNDAVKGLQENFGMSESDSIRAATAVQSSIGFGRSQAIAAAQQLVNTGTGYTGHQIFQRDAAGNIMKDAAGNNIVTGEVTALEEMTNTLARASGGNSSTASGLAGFANFQAKAKGRHDLAPGFGTLDNLVKREAGIDTSPLPPGTTRESLYVTATENAWNSGSLYSLANGKDQQLKALAKHWTQQYKEGMETGNLEQIRKARTAKIEMEAMLPNATGGNAITLNAARADFDFIDREHSDYISGLAQREGRTVQETMSLIDQAAFAQARTYQRDPAEQARLAGN